MKGKLSQIRRITILASLLILASIGFQLFFWLTFGTGYTLGYEGIILFAVLVIAVFAPRFFRRKKESVT